MDEVIEQGIDGLLYMIEEYKDGDEDIKSILNGN